jgi:sigma-E factor negative regulatory protein RseA
MTERINDQISAFIDDELSAEESSLLLRRFERDANARTQALRYTMIGAALRGELLQPQSQLLRRRIAAALDGTVPAVKPRPPSRSARYARPLLGLGIAAAVAVAAIGTLRLVNESAVAPAGSPAGATASVDPIVAPSYVVPQDATPSGPVTSPIRLTNYLIHHSAYASGLGRASVSSNVVGASVEPVAQQAEEADQQWR